MTAWLELVGLSLGSVGAGVVAGVYFAFSTFVMNSLSLRPHSEAIATMQSINKVILSSLFMTVFFGTTVLSLALMFASITSVNPVAWLMFVGGLIYVVGMFFVTVFFNVPLNDGLEELQPHEPESAAFWQTYLKRWVRWNHVRAVASAVASLAYLLVYAEVHMF